MSESKSYTLKPIAKAEFDKLFPHRTDYLDIVNKFLNGNEDVVEVIPMRKSITTFYQGLKAYAKRKDYSFLVRKREGRLFLLKRHPNEVKL